MISMRSTLTALAAVLVAAATLAPTAAAGDGGAAATHYTPQALNALELRWQAMASPDNQPIGNSGAASYYPQRAVDALGRRGAAMADGYSSRTAPGGRGSFDWIDAGVGAGATLGLVLLVAAGVVIRSRRSIGLATR